MNYIEYWGLKLPFLESGNLNGLQTPASSFVTSAISIETLLHAPPFSLQPRTTTTPWHLAFAATIFSGINHRRTAVGIEGERKSMTRERDRTSGKRGFRGGSGCVGRRRKKLSATTTDSTLTADDLPLPVVFCCCGSWVTLKQVARGSPATVAGVDSDERLLSRLAHKFSSFSLVYTI